MAYQFSQSQLDWAKSQNLDLKNPQGFNLKLPDGTIIKSSINPGEAATKVVPTHTGPELHKIATDWLTSQGGKLTDRAGAGLTGSGASNVWVLGDGRKMEVGKDFYENIAQQQLTAQGKQVVQGGILDRSTAEGQQIASGFTGQNVVNPQQELAKAYAETPVVGGQQQALGQPFGDFTTAGTPTPPTQGQPQTPKPFGDFTYGPETPQTPQPNQDMSQQLNQMMTTLQGMQQQAGGQTGQPGQASGYTGPSIVDYLASVGQPSDFATRQKLAQQMGIQNYTGTAEQNTQLLNSMRGGTQPVSPTIQPGQPPAQAITNSADTKVQNSLQSITTGDPTKTLTDIVKELSISMGLPDITNQIQELDDKMTQEISDINLNPWTSEAERSKRSSLTQQKYESRKSALIDRLKLQNDVVRQAVDYYESERNYQKEMMKIQLDEAQRSIQNRLAETKMVMDERKKLPGSVVSPYQVGSLTPEQSQTLDRLGLEPRQQEIVSAIMRGEQPPITTIQRTPEITGILGGLAALGYDNTKAVQDWTSMQKRLASLNSTQQVRLTQAVTSLEGSIEQADGLYSEWQSTGLPSGYSSYNKAALFASAELSGQSGVVARTLISHIEDMANELAVVYRGGNTPTDMALESARKSLDSSWNEAQFKRNLDLIGQNLRIRKNSMTQASQVEGNIYNPDIGPLETVYGTPEELPVDVIGREQGGLLNSIRTFLFGK